MFNEKERQEHYSIAETIFHKIEHLRDFEKAEAFNRELNAIDDRYRAGVGLLVWSWVKYGKPKKTKFERLSIAYSAITKVADSKGKRFSIAIAVCIAVGGSLVWKGSLSLPISGGAAKEDELRDWRANGGKNLIVFIHGLRDDGEETWTSPNTNISWQSLLLEDERFSEYDIKSYHYASYLFDGTRLSIPNVSDQLSVRLNSQTVAQYENIVFIAHSMGGLVIRNFLLKRRELADKVPLVYFLATPTAGSHIANLSRTLDLNRQQVLAMQTFENSTFLQDQNSMWRNWPEAERVYSLCAFETLETMGIIVVDQASAQSLCDGPTLPVNENHSGIVKPDARDSIVNQKLITKLRELELISSSN